MPLTLDYIPQPVSDVVLHAWGTSREEVFSAALRELNEVLKPGACGGPRHSDCCMRIEVESPDAVALLVDFLSRALALSQVQKSLFCYVYFDQLEERRLSARLFGRWHDGLKNPVRAVSYHEAALKRNADGRWVAHILCAM